VGLLTIGAFARASGLSPKALRLYDDLGLLAPAIVDPQTGYRHYRRDQLDQARLVAWLRRIGMPLARIASITRLSPEAAAREVAEFWDQVEADVTERRAVASFLVEHLSRKDHAVPTELLLRCAAVADRGLVRPLHQDVAYADDHLLAVADGFGPRGAQASAVAVETLVRHRPAAGDVLAALREAAGRADESVRTVAESESESGSGSGSEPWPRTGTTLTALAWSGSQLALIHIGDSRGYLLREGRLLRLTHDHTVVQEMVDDGRLTAAEAESHPHRAVLVRALDGGGPAPHDSSLQDPRPGDRYLLCSDGVHAVLPEEILRAVLVDLSEPEEVLAELVRRVRDAGAPDNVACALADVVASSR
jgi:serine/threonine protein phosphatase PrpC/DNA-binding transcriptional MerR regulator